MALHLLGSSFPLPANTQVFMEPAEVQISGRRFARPCPLVPCHGFVESRPVDNTKEASQLFAEARLVDPHAELVVMPVIDAIASAIWTPGQLVIGPGNDGATAGHGAHTLEVTGDLTSEKLLNKAGITDSPFMEFVQDNDQTWVVQLRNGPPVPAGVNDYIPERITVKNVIMLPADPALRPDLLTWAEMVQSLPEGTVVCHPGGGLADHYAVHCVQAWVFKKLQYPIAVVTTYEPHVGDILEKVQVQQAEPDVRELQYGFKLALTHKFSKAHMHKAACAMLAGVHNAAVWMGKRDRLVGYGMGMAFRLTHTACMGELRHKFGKEVGGSGTRDAVYARWWGKTFMARGKLVEAIKLFYDDVWSGSYGGPRWGDFAWCAVRLFNRVATGDYSGAIEVYNELVNCVHNN